MYCLNCGNPLKPDTRYCARCGASAPVTRMETMATPQDPRIAAIEQALGHKYKVLRKIGSGGFADVYLGEHAQLGREVAIKILTRSHSAEEEMVERFRRESKAAAKLSHPNIIDIYDVGESREIYYFVMKYISGETLARKMQREKKVPPVDAIYIVRQIADALSYAHEHNVVHRDIKPANVMLDEYGKPVLMDFGIARVQFGGQLTRTGTVMGTPHYLSPEQPLGKQVDGRSDLYSLGIMFYEMLAGRVPFHDDAAIALIYKHINEAPPPLHEVAPELPLDLCMIVHKLIEKLQENRYQSAGDLIDALDTLEEIYPIRSTPSSRRSTPGIRRSTDKLVLLAEEHLQQDKLDKALEIYAGILKRHPDYLEVREKMEAGLQKLRDSASKLISEAEFGEARAVLARMERLSSDDTRLIFLKSDLEAEEQKHKKEAEFKNSYDAAVLALKHDNATGAVDLLTKALTVDPANREANELLRQARSAYESNRSKAELANLVAEAEYHLQHGSFDVALAAVKKASEIDQSSGVLQLQEKIQSAVKEKAYREGELERISAEVDQLCEKLNFTGAQSLLESVRERFPDLAKSSLGIIQRNRLLHQPFARAEELFEQNKFEEARLSYQEFLNKPQSYDFQVFYTLRKRAEEMLPVIRSRIEEAELEQRIKKADVFLRMGQFDLARKECEAVLEKNKTHPEAIAKLKDIEGKEVALKKKEEGPDTGEVLREVAAVQTVQVPRPSAPGKVLPSPSVVIPPAPAPLRPVPVPKISRSLPVGLLIGAGSGVVLAAVFLAFVFWNPGSSSPTVKPSQNPVVIPPSTEKPKPAIVATTLPVSIDVTPWANFEIQGGALKAPITDTTPVVVKLAPGRYSILFRNPDFPSFNETIIVDESNTTFHFQFKQLDTESLANSLVQ